MAKKRVLVASPIRQKPAILDEFLKSLEALEQSNTDINYMFVDDNDSDESKQLLHSFKQRHNSVTIYEVQCHDQYNCDHETHYWNLNLIWKVADFKDMIIQTSLEQGYDYLFLVDSDIVMRDKTVEHLVNTNFDIISEVFWTRWYSDSPELPNAWLFDSYDMAPRRLGERLTEEELFKRQQSFLDQLRKPGIYEVGGLGACTLISRTAMMKGVRFKPIKNLSFWGEDRHFCVRAIALGIDLYLDTHYPAYHIYRESDIYGVDNYKSKI